MQSSILPISSVICADTGEKYEDILLPKTAKQAMSSSYAEEWKTAMEEEIRSLHEQGRYLGVSRENSRYERCRKQMGFQYQKESFGSGCSIKGKISCLRV